MAIEATFHSKLRYVQRILGITDDKESKQYLAVHDESVTQKVLKLYEHAFFIYQGQLSSDKANTRPIKYYIRDNTVVITDITNSKIVTLYNVDYGFPDKTNRVVLHDLIEELQNLQEQLESAKVECYITSDDVRYQISTYTQSIANMEHQLKIMKELKASSEQELLNLTNKQILLTKQVDSCASKICNSIELKRDIDQKIFST